ncbi:MAG: GNAT family N-acetyltransferase [Clostridiales bacterium]|nr:GNAT family N-acetyltransferase [Clostridiales bacterium]
MEVTLVRASVDDAETIWKMQLVAFQELLDRYQDLDTNPGNEQLEKVQWRFSFPATYFYFIQVDGMNAGAIRIIDHHDESPKRISPLFVLPDFRGRGVAQAAIREAERIHGSSNWSLGTILQEKGNCHLYEKMGYRQTGESKVINDRMTLVFYAK